MAIRKYRWEDSSGIQRAYKISGLTALRKEGLRLYIKLQRMILAKIRKCLQDQLSGVASTLPALSRPSFSVTPAFSRFFNGQHRSLLKVAKL